jgi:hypothetical protein
MGVRAWIGRTIWRRSSLAGDVIVRGERGRRSNKRMQLTKLRAAPVLQTEVPPCAPAGETDGGTASQLIRSVRRTGPSRGRTASGWQAVPA